MEDLKGYVFTCQDCKFMLTLLGQANRYGEVETCPCCGGSLDYSRLGETRDYIKRLKVELSYINEKD